MISNSTLIGSVLVIGVYYIFLSTLLTNAPDQPPPPPPTSAPENDLKQGRIQGIFDLCKRNYGILSNSLESSLQHKCTGDPPRKWNATACSVKNNTQSIDQVYIFISTTLPIGGEFCGEQIIKSVMCAISTSLIKNNIKEIQNSVTKEVYRDLSRIFGINSNKTRFKIKINDENNFCFPLSVQFKEQGHGHFVVKTLKFSNHDSKPQTIESQRKQLIYKVINKIQNKLQDNGIYAQIMWRIKSPGSIRMKLILTNQAIEQLNDIIGIRFIVNREDECYKVIDIIHRLFKYDRDNYKDYIKNKKSSGYQSLHTILLGDKFKHGAKFHTNIEIQVRTFQMDYVAEHGTAAHSTYKQNQTQLVKQLI